MLSSTDSAEPPFQPDAPGSAGYFAGVSEIVTKIHAAQNEPEAVSLLQIATRRMGADVSAFVSFVRDDESHESYRFLLACDPAWCFEYEAQAWYANDPWLAYAMAHSEPTRGRDIPISTERQRAVVNLAQRYGFLSAMIVPAPSAGGLSRLGVLALGSGKAGFFDDDTRFTAVKLVARSAAMELHDWWVAQVKRELIVNARLTQDDLFLLTRERQGHSTKRIANELGTTPGSIDARFQRVNAKLGVPNRKAAARVAAEYGLI